jgi:hypothetical protein
VHVGEVGSKNSARIVVETLKVVPPILGWRSGRLVQRPKERTTVVVSLWGCPIEQDVVVSYSAMGLENIDETLEVTGKVL